MATSLYFEVFAPGMKAKLDPTYRHGYAAKHLPERAEIMGRIYRNSQQSFMPFTKVKKVNNIFDR